MKRSEKNKSSLFRFKNSKRAEGVFGMSFGMIFSIILIVIFIIVGFIAIRSFLNFQKTSQMNMFANDLQSDIDEAWNAGESSIVFKGNLPPGVEYVCFINWKNATLGANNIEKAVYQDIKLGGITASDNFYFYAPTKNYVLKSKQIKHIDFSNKNPICAKVINNQVSIRIVKTFENPLVVVSE